MMLSMTSFKFGQIVLVRFPFTDQRGGKQRPAVVISSTAYNQVRPDVILMAVTRRLQASVGWGEAVIQDWQTAGLLKPSTLKPIVFTAEKTIVRKVLGVFGHRDQATLKTVIESIIG